MMIEIKPLDTLTTHRECALKLLEEASEACEAMKLLDHLLEKVEKGDDLVHVEIIKAYKINALSELADVAQCMCNCLQVLDPAGIDWERAVQAVREHNLERGRNEMPGTRTLKIDWH